MHAAELARAPPGAVGLPVMIASGRVAAAESRRHGPGCQPCTRSLARRSDHRTVTPAARSLSDWPRGQVQLQVELTGRLEVRSGAAAPRLASGPGGRLGMAARPGGGRRLATLRAAA